MWSVYLAFPYDTADLSLATDASARKCGRSVADPYNFDTDPDSGCEKICYGSGFRIQPFFDTDLDPGK